MSPSPIASGAGQLLWVVVKLRVIGSYHSEGERRQSESTAVIWGQ